MDLIAFVENLDEYDEDQIIFQENTDVYDSEIILECGEESDYGHKIKDGRSYKYLIEVALAKEFVGDWREASDHKPSAIETAKRLHDYAKYDA